MKTLHGYLSFAANPRFARAGLYSVSAVAAVALHRTNRGLFSALSGNDPFRINAHSSDLRQDSISKLATASPRADTSQDYVESIILQLSNGLRPDYQQRHPLDTLHRPGQRRRQFIAVATILDVTGLTNEVALEAASTLITSLSAHIRPNVRGFVMNRMQIFFPDLSLGTPAIFFMGERSFQGMSFESLKPKSIDPEDVLSNAHRGFRLH